MDSKFVFLTSLFLAGSLAFYVGYRTRTGLVDAEQQSQSKVARTPDETLCDSLRSSTTDEFLESKSNEFFRIANVKFDEKCNPTITVVFDFKKDDVEFDNENAHEALMPIVCGVLTDGSMPTTSDHVTYDVRDRDKHVAYVTVTAVECTQPSASTNL